MKNDFIETVKNGGEFEGYNFNLNNTKITLNENNLNAKILYFKDCVFNSGDLKFENIKNLEFLLSFENCEINCNLSIFNCQIKTFSLIDIKKIKSLDIGSFKEKPCEFDLFQFYNGLTDKPIYNLESDIYISNSVFKNGDLRIEKISHVNGRFVFRDNNVLRRDSEMYHNSIFDNSTLTFATFSNNKFENSVSFKKTTFINNYHYDEIKNITEPNLYNPFFQYNVFENVDFSGSNFIGFSQFISCIFKRTANFNFFKTSKKSLLLFSDCEFNGTTHFSDCETDSTSFLKCNFDKITTFNDSIFNKLFFIKVKFDKIAFFDHLTINSVEKKEFLKSESKELNNWKVTLRTIKQELQKAENRIDFNRFRAYELAAHYKELTWKDHFVDKSILCATKWSTNFGNSWRRALRFTLLIGFVFYILFFISENYNYSFDINHHERFTSGLFRFFLVTDFFNPLETDRVYLTNPISWNIFILGKIFIAYGIYEMIQAFRKFKP